MPKNSHSKCIWILNLLLAVVFLNQPYSLLADNRVDIPHLYFRQILDGLSQSSVKCIAEDRLGYIWIGTEGGLNRFDGMNIRMFKMDEADSTAIPDSRINDLFIDSRQNLWIATYHALALYVEKTDNFLVFNKTFKKGEDPNLDALTLFEDSKGQLWIGTEHGLYVLASGSPILKRSWIKELTRLDSLKIFAIEEVAGNLLFGTDEGLFLFDRKTQSLQEIISHEEQRLEGEIRDILADSYDRIWVATYEKGLYQIEQDGQEDWFFKSYNTSPHRELEDHRIFSVFEDSRHRIWVGTERMGLNLYVPQWDSFWAYTQDQSDRGALRTNSIWQVFEDRSGRLYFGSNFQGMFVHDPYAVNFNHVDQRFGLRLKSNTVSSFLEVGEKMWIGTDGGGISVWNRKENSYTFLLHNPQDKASLGSNEVLEIFQDSRGIIWTGNWNGGLNQYEPATGSFRTYQKNDSPRSIGSNNVMSIDEDANGNLWMSTWGHGISRYNRATDDFFNIGYIPYNNQLLAHEMTYDIEVDDLTGDIWVATVLGLDRVRMLDQEKFKITRFGHQEDDARSLSVGNVNCIFEDAQNRLWVGTKNGLNLFDRNTEDFTRFTTQDGLSSNFIQDIIQDDQGNYWITTARGLTKMTAKEDDFACKIYTKSDGLQADNFYIMANYKTADGEIFLGGVNGFNYFDPDELGPNPFPPQIQFSSFKLFNEEVRIGGPESPLPTHINTLNAITLLRSQSSFAIEYYGLNMTSPEKHQYAYKLEGFDENWIDAGNRNYANYTNLDAGEYVFLVKAANRDGISTLSPRKIKITVLPAWWETFWARCIFVCFPLAILLSIVLFRFSMIKKQKKQLAIQVAIQTAELVQQKNEIEIQAEQLRRVNQQKNKLFSIISHDLRSPIYSLKGIANMLDPDILNAQDLQKMKTNISRRIDNVGHVLVNLLDWAKSQLEGENSRIEAFDLTPISEEICKMYQPTALEKNIVLLNSISEPLRLQADPNQIRVVLRNLIGNALKFTHAEDLVSLGYESVSEQEVCIKISDTGVGMNEDQLSKLFHIETNQSSAGTAGEKGVGLGLLLVKEFVEKNGGTISVESSPGVGTTFRIYLPRP